MASASFDVLGTCFFFSAPIAATRARLGTVLARHGIDASTLVFAWFYAAQRDFTYTSTSGAYRPLGQILALTLRRACCIVDVPGTAVSDADVGAIMDAFGQLQLRAGMAACLGGLAAAGWDVYAVTNGAVQTTVACFAGAQVELDGAHLLSCDELRVAKPHARVYENVHARLDGRGLGCKDGHRWFVAAHAWDLMAARRAGFKTAWLAFEEHEPVPEVFGEFDIYAADMEDLLAKLMEVK